MQFITNGPDIPDVLLQAHEEGRVVFFCGAGISYPTGLPGFKGLVDKLYQLLGTELEENEKQAYEQSKFDATLDLLERRYPGQRLAVRKKLLDALKPNLRRKGAKDTHIALLLLGRNRGGALRLVTTNFDRVFEHVAKRKQSLHATAAPTLPVPKNSRWDGLVYLHGLLPSQSDDYALQRLVLTSGDFGLAYLTERWAARFVSELFRNYVVCFVGYSINDPVFRYMMDALAADRMLGEKSHQAYAFGDYEAGQKEQKANEWETKGVVPVLYNSINNHSLLHNSLKVWAKTYQDGTLGKEHIVVEHALAIPAASTRQDDFVGRMLWALSDESGLPAKRFAEINPAPPIEWLTALSEDRFEHNDLGRFGVSPLPLPDNKLRFSLIHRPARYDDAPWMGLIGRRLNSGWDKVMFQLARWLTRHLNDPRLILWLSKWGGQLHGSWAALIEDELERFAKLERDGNTDKLDEIRANSPNAIPDEGLRSLWRLLLTNRIKSPWHNFDLYSWKQRFKRDGLSASLRMELRGLLSPKISLRMPFREGIEISEPDSPLSLRQLVDWELVLAADYVQSTLDDMTSKHWQEALPELLEDFQLLLRDTLDLMRELGETNETSDRSDHSYWHLPSISPHWQNRGHHDWVKLIELLRDAWLAVKNVDTVLATRIAQRWFELPYPTFKRLAFFSASDSDCIASEKWVSWLLENDAWWLWSVETQREVMRLLVLQGHRLASMQNRLEAAILNGPPREMFQEELEPQRWLALTEHTVWLRLSKLEESGISLGKAAGDRFSKLSKAHPEWQPNSHESDEFPLWMSGSGDPDFEENREIDIAPHERDELIQWLSNRSVNRFPFHEDTWREVCRERFADCIFALRHLALENNWPAGRWREALHVWSEEDLVQQSWQQAASLVKSMPDHLVEEIAHGIAWWLKAASKYIEQHENILLDLCRRILDVPLEPSSVIKQNGQSIQQPITEAINHPVGLVTEALLNFWLKRSPNDNDGFPTEIEPFFSRICEDQNDRFRHGRVILASRLITLYRADLLWTEQRLLPLFCWEENGTEAKTVWEGFLWSPRLYQPLLIAFKPQLLETVNHYHELGERKQQFAAFLTYAALQRIDGFTLKELKLALGALPQAGLQYAAMAVARALEGAGEQREDYWKNRIQPFWRDCWPQSIDNASTSIAESAARMSIAAGAEFPSALESISNWLQPIRHLHHIVRRLHESKLCLQFPEESLQLLDCVIQDQQWGAPDLRYCLENIAEAKPYLKQDSRYKRLDEYARQEGRG